MNATTIRNQLLQLDQETMAIRRSLKNHHSPNDDRYIELIELATRVSNLSQKYERIIKMLQEK